MATYKELPPDAARLAEGLRDTGYQFETAIADIVDNSIAAEAVNIAIDLKLTMQGSILVRVVDDGTGMDEKALVEAMVYGAKARPSPASLGKFGLGLKTASTAFCRELVVISRKDAAAPLMRACWDLDHIEKVNRWELQFDAASAKEEKEFAEKLPGGKGTMVVWGKIDRLLSHYIKATGAARRKALSEVEDKLRTHLSTIFQRFLDPEDKRTKTVKITLNDKELVAWDPFCTKESEQVSELDQDVELPNGTKTTFRLRSYILPRQEEFDTPEAAANARISNAEQGVYIYRENRLIHGPDWLKMFAKEPHYSLLRVEFSFDHQLDEGLQIDIKKSQIILNASLHHVLTDFLNPVRREAQMRYRTGSRQKTAEAAKGVHDVSNRNIAGKADLINQPGILNANEAKNEATIHNPQGEFTIKIQVSPASKPHEVAVRTVSEIPDGHLWRPVIIREGGKSHVGVEINTSHPYYLKVYQPNFKEGVTIQGMDALFWGLAVSETNCTAPVLVKTFDELRYEVSRTLRKLVEDLPDPENM